MQKLKFAASLACAVLAMTMLAPSANADELDEGTPGGSAPAPLTEEQMAEHPDAAWYAVGGASGEILTSEDEIVPDLVAQAPGEVSPYLINDPAAWTACFVQHDEGYTLAGFQWWTESSATININLNCGYHNSATGAGTGWHHIAAGHESQWRNRIIQIGESVDGAGWDDLMAWQIQQAMDFPTINVDKTNGKRCVGSPVLMYESDGTYVYTFYPTTIFTTDSKIVVTSIPGTNYTC